MSWTRRTTTNCYFNTFLILLLRLPPLTGEQLKTNPLEAIIATILPANDTVNPAHLSKNDHREIGFTARLMTKEAGGFSHGGDDPWSCLLIGELVPYIPQGQTNEHEWLDRQYRQPYEASQSLLSPFGAQMAAFRKDSLDPRPLFSSQIVQAVVSEASIHALDSSACFSCHACPLPWVCASMAWMRDNGEFLLTAESRAMFIWICGPIRLKSPRILPAKSAKVEPREELREWHPVGVC